MNFRGLSNTKLLAELVFVACQQGWNNGANRKMAVKRLADADRIARELQKRLGDSQDAKDIIKEWGLIP